jgi:hypothetical protein
MFERSELRSSREGLKRDGDGSIFLNKKPGTMKYRLGLKNRTVPYLNPLSEGSEAIPKDLVLSRIW